MSRDYDEETVARFRRLLNDTAPDDAELIRAARDARYSATSLKWRQARS